MAAVLDEDGEVGFEEGMLWLPSYVVDEACDTKACTSHRHQNYQHLGHRELVSQQISKCSSSWYQKRPKLGNGGPGMQAIFLESGERSCGTGVFLPQSAATNFQSSKKPACAPVLLPARVVRALNLNVHALGLQVSPRQDPKHNARKCEVYNNSSKKKNEPKDAFKRYYFGVVSENQTSSPEIFLPKEWTY